MKGSAEDQAQVHKYCVGEGTVSLEKSDAGSFKMT